MDSKKIRKSIGRFIGWLLLKICSLIIKVLPVFFLYRFAAALAGSGYLFAVKQRKIALESLDVAFGSAKTPAEIKQIARDCFIFMAKSGIEILYFMDRPQRIKERIEIIGKEHLDAVLAMGKGVILVSAHFGNFPLMLMRLSMEGYHTSGIMRPMRDKRVEKIFLSRRDSFKINTIYSYPRKECVENTLRSLRSNELLFIPMDQNFGTGGIFVDFFGKKAATATGPVVLAMRTKAALLPCFIIRQKDDTHKIVFEPALNLEYGRDKRESIFINTQRLTNIIEQYIRKYPADWGWIHRRWKSRLGTK